MWDGLWFYGALFSVGAVAAALGPRVYGYGGKQSWQSMAKRRGLQFQDFHPLNGVIEHELSTYYNFFEDFDRVPTGACQISGTMSDLRVCARLDIHATWGDARYNKTSIEVSYPGEVPHDMVLTTEGLAAKLGKLVGQDELEVGDAELDEAFVIRGAFVEEVGPFVRDPRTRSSLLAMRRAHPSIRFDRMGVHVEARGIWSAKRVEEALAFLSSHVRRIADAQAARAQQEAP